MLAPSSVPMVSAPLSANFMLPVPEASVPAVEICSRQVGGRDDLLGQRHAVVRQEHHLQPAADAGSWLTTSRHVVDQPDDQLGHVVARRRLAGEHHGARHPVRLPDRRRMPVVARARSAATFSSWRLYSWMRLTCTSNIDSRIDVDAGRARCTSRPAAACWRA